MQEQPNQEALDLTRSKGPSERLLKGMTQEERDRFVRSYGRAKTVLKKINEFAGKEVATKNIMGDNPKAFEVANWPYLQAWYAGYRHAMRTTQDLTRTT